MYDLIISVDPSYSKKIGIAWMSNGVVMFTSLLEKSDYDIKTRNMHNICLKVFDFLCGLINDKKTLVLIEGQWLGRNPAVFAGLVEIRCLLTGMLLAKYRDLIDVQSVLPNIWQQAILEARRLTSKDLKVLSKKKAADITKQEPTEDESDAICILQYGLSKFKQN